LPAPLAGIAVVTTGNGDNQVRPGDTWAFQFLYRDQGQRNTSNALRAVFVP
jgi:hypothetical protein